MFSLLFEVIIFEINLRGKQMGLSRMDYQEARATMDTGHRTKTNLSFYTRNVGFLIARMR